MAPRSFFLLAALASLSGLASADTGPSPFSCIAHAIPPTGYVCGTSGTILDGRGRSGPTPDLHACARNCEWDGDCGFFTFENGQCDRFYTKWTDAGFKETNTNINNQAPRKWWQKECFWCGSRNDVLSISSDLSVVLNLRFDAPRDVEAWELEYFDDDVDGDWDYDIVSTQFEDSQERMQQTKALRVVDRGSGGSFVIARYVDGFDLEAGVLYTISVSIKSVPHVSEIGDSLSLWFPTEGGERVSASHLKLSDASNEGGGWFRWEFTFKPTAAQAGETQMEFQIEPSGESREWFFDEILVKEA